MGKVYNLDNDNSLAKGANQFSGFTEKTSPASGDLLIVEDSGDSYNKKKVQIGNLPADGSVSQAKLKTASGEISIGYNTFSISVLPGGEYGFYPQVKMASSSSGEAYQAVVLSGGDNSSGISYTSSNLSPWTSYKTVITLVSSSDYGMSVQQRYITASGKDHFIFLLIAKNDEYDDKGNIITKKGSIIAGYQAPDHPCANQGGLTEVDLPHPFGSYDPNKHEIILVDNSILKDLLPLVDYKNTLLTLINEKCIIDDYKRPTFKPREIIQINEFPHKPIGEVIDRFSIKKAIKTGLAPSGVEVFFTRDEVTKERRVIEKLPDDILFKAMRLKEA